VIRAAAQADPLRGFSAEQLPTFRPPRRPIEHHQPSVGVVPPLGKGEGILVVEDGGEYGAEPLD